MHRGALLVGLLSLLGCGPGARRSSGDGGTADGVGVDAFSGEVPPGCGDVQFQGTINGKSFAEALQESLQSPGPYGRWVPTGLWVAGASDSRGLECFNSEGLVVEFLQCPGPLRITSLPSGLAEVWVWPTCTVADISAVAGVDQVILLDASLVTDFSPLAQASTVEVGGYVPLGSVAPYVQNATSLGLTVVATSLSPLNNATAKYLNVDVKGVTSLKDFQPQATLTCFSIQLEDLSPQDAAAETLPLCTATRDGRQCPNYKLCWPQDVP